MKDELENKQGNLEKLVVRLDWQESERGWGVRPDGCSLHLTVNDCTQFVREYWDKMPHFAPDEYERPCSEPYNVMVPADLYKEVHTSKNGIRMYQFEMHRLRK